MSKPPTAPSPKATKPRKRGTREQTRQRLMDATIDLIRREGLAALTTVRITEQAGIVQSGFYAHFKNIEDCLAAAAEHVVDRQRLVQSDFRSRAYAQLLVTDDGVRYGNMRALWERSLDLMLEDRVFAELFLRYRRDASSLGKRVRKVFDQARADMARDMNEVAPRLGIGQEFQPYTAFWGDLVLGMWLTATEALLDGTHDRDVVLTMLAQTTCAGSIAGARAAQRQEVERKMTLASTS